MRAPTVAFVSLLVLGACSVPEKHPSGSSDAGATDAGVDADERNVTGASMLTHYVRSGNSVTTMTAPEDLTIYSFAAYVPDASQASGFRVINGSGDAQGVLTIPDVPVGPYYLRVLLSGASAPTFYYTDDRSLQLGYGTAGKPGLPDVTLPSTINPNITGLDRAWDTDWFTLHSLGTGTEHYPITFSAAQPVGAVPSLTVPFDWTSGYGWALPRMRPKLLQDDDVEILHHRVTNTFVMNESTDISRLVEIARVTGLTQTNGMPLTVNGAFQDVPLDRSVMLDLQLDPLRQTYTTTAPHGQELVTVGLGVLLGSDPNNRFGPGLVNYGVFNLRSSVSSITQNLAYGMPYDGTWAFIASETYQRRRRVRVPGATTGGNAVPSTVGATRLYTSGPIGPTIQVAPPTNLRVGGNAAADGVRTLGTGPVLVQWTGAATANRYSVSVRRIVAGNQANVVATFVTTETSVSMPADVLATGERYVFVIGAIRDSLPFASGRLRAEVVPSYFASTASGVILFSNTCGNGTREAGEECDTAGPSATCDVDCSLPVCLDGVLNTLANEQCDAGFQTGTCDNDCTLRACGDGHVNVTAGEECDDSNTDPGDGCSAECRWETNLCGDGTPQGTHGEECDDANNVTTDGCINCRGAFCGDGFVQAGVEACDDGNYINGDGCSDQCTTEP